MASTTKTFTCILLPPWDHHETTCTRVFELAQWTAQLGGETVDQYRTSTLGALSDWMANAKHGDAVYLDEDLKMTDEPEHADFELSCD